MKPKTTCQTTSQRCIVAHAASGDKAAQGIASPHGSPYENNWNDISPETIKYLFKTLAGGTGGFMADSASLLNVLASGSAPEVSEVPFLPDLACVNRR